MKNNSGNLGSGGIWELGDQWRNSDIAAIQRWQTFKNIFKNFVEWPNLCSYSRHFNKKLAGMPLLGTQEFGDAEHGEIGIWGCVNLGMQEPRGVGACGRGIMGMRGIKGVRNLNQPVGKGPFPFEGRSAILIRQDMSPHVPALLQKCVRVRRLLSITVCTVKPF